MVLLLYIPMLLILKRLQPAYCEIVVNQGALLQADLFKAFRLKEVDIPLKEQQGHGCVVIWITAILQPRPGGLSVIWRC